MIEFHRKEKVGAIAKIHTQNLAIPERNRIHLAIGEFRKREITTRKFTLNKTIRGKGSVRKIAINEGTTFEFPFLGPLFRVHNFLE